MWLIEKSSAASEGGLGACPHKEKDIRLTAKKAGGSLVLHARVPLAHARENPPP